MDDQVLAMMRDRFDALDEKLTAMTAALQAHHEKDERYWLKIDQQQAQISLMRWLLGGGAGAALIAWIVERKFLGH